MPRTSNVRQTLDVHAAVSNVSDGSIKLMPRSWGAVRQLRPACVYTCRPVDTSPATRDNASSIINSLEAGTPLAIIKTHRDRSYSPALTDTDGRRRQYDH